jgi:hypothetical protein
MKICEKISENFVVGQTSNSRSSQAKLCRRRGSIRFRTGESRRFRRPRGRIPTRRQETTLAIRYGEEFSENFLRIFLEIYSDQVIASSFPNSEVMRSALSGFALSSINEGENFLGNFYVHDDVM